MKLSEFGTLLDSRWRILSLPFQNCLKKYGEEYREDAEWLLDFFLRMAVHFGDDFVGVIGRYHDQVQEQVKEQKEFSRTGRYRYSREEQIRDIISGEEFQKENLYTLLLSYILALHRYELLLYIQSFTERRIGPGSRCLQIGTGIGLEAYLVDQRKARIETYDLNPYSAQCLELLDVSSGVRFFPEMYPFNEEEAFDHSLVVELMEHLEDPANFLNDLSRVMKRGGDALLTFAIRMPQIDHIYCFKTVTEARKMIEGSGLKISEEDYFISSFFGIDESQKEALAESSQYAAVYACVAGKPLL